MFYISQVAKDDCGFACLKMVLAEINKDKNYLFLPQDENHGRYSFQELLDIAQCYGVTMCAFCATNKESAKDKPCVPFIAVLTLQNGAKHAVVVEKIRFGRVTYLDPRCGKVKVSFGHFLSDWDGTGLMVIDFHKRKSPINAIKPIPLVQKIWLGIIQMLSGTFTVLGIYFLKDDVSIIWPIIFLSASIICEILMKIVAYHLMKKMDKFFFEEKRIPEHGFKDYLNRFEEYKKLSLSSPMNYVLAIIFSVGLVTVILLNDYRNLVITIIPVILSFLEVVVLFPILRKKKQAIAELEDGLNNAESAVDFKEKVHDMHRLAYRYSYINFAYSGFSAMMILLAVILTMYYCKISSLPFIVFYSLFSVALLKSTRSLFSLNEKKQEFNKAKVKISNIIKSCD